MMSRLMLNLRDPQLHKQRHTPGGGHEDEVTFSPNLDHLTGPVTSRVFHNGNPGGISTQFSSDEIDFVVPYTGSNLSRQPYADETHSRASRLDGTGRYGMNSGSEYKYAYHPHYLPRQNQDGAPMGPERFVSGER